MLFHFSCPYEKVSKQSTNWNIFTQALNYSDKNAIMREKMVVDPCRSVLTSLLSISLNCSATTKKTEFFGSGFCFRSDSLEALTLLTGKWSTDLIRVAKRLSSIISLEIKKWKIRFATLLETHIVKTIFV